VSDRFVLFEFDSLGLEVSRFSTHGAHVSTVWTRLLLAEGVGLLFEERLECPFRDALCGGLGDLFHECEVDIETGAVFAEGTTRDDFSPLGGELA